ncbi:esterase LipW [Mollisia scopiformis]|uniref:Esterase LipW n=1 Tax=Mollisia scopiformis TaxID=149040 RepID=A0A194WUE9_MOLSC|nr:esterase LipW [Mollisia scopiformis]KUJ11237.1 esterase LipW [Mollisia scopiformis]
MSSLISKPCMDPELRLALGKVSFPPISRITPEIWKAMRVANATPPSFLDDQKVRGISHREVRISSQDGSNHEIILSILQRSVETTEPRPCLYWIHGGGLHWGDRLHTLEFPTDVILECDAVCISVEYRLAPEHPFCTSVEDCYTGLQWTSDHTQELGIDPKRLMVGGSSAGGALAASIALLCRDRTGPSLCAQVLFCPMLDDSLATVSSRQYVECSDFVPRGVFEDSWKASLANNGQNSNTVVLPPARVKDLSGLPPAYLDVGSAEVLRDETVAFASRLWENGVQADLHVWSGGFHGFDIFLPDAAVSQSSRRSKLMWARKVFQANSS